MALSEPETCRLGRLGGQQAPVWDWPVLATPHPQSSASTAVWWALDLNSVPLAFTAAVPSPPTLYQTFLSPKRRKRNSIGNSSHFETIGQ